MIVAARLYQTILRKNADGVRTRAIPKIHSCAIGGTFQTRSSFGPLVAWFSISRTRCSLGALGSSGALRTLTHLL